MWLYSKRGRALGSAAEVKNKKQKASKQHVELNKDRDVEFYRINWKAKLEKGEQRNLRKEWGRRRECIF